MFIHLGGDRIIRANQLIAIFDLGVEASKVSRQFIAHAEQAHKTEVIGEEEPKSLVVTEEKIYYSPISSATLFKRASANAAS